MTKQEKLEKLKELNALLDVFWQDYERDIDSAPLVEAVRAEHLYGKLFTQLRRAGINLYEFPEPTSDLLFAARKYGIWHFKDLLRSVKV